MPESKSTSAKKKTEKKIEGTTPGPSTPTKTPSTSASEKKSRTVEVEVDPGVIKGKRPSDEQVIQRQDSAYRLRLLGKTPEEIGEVMGLAPRTVRDYIMKARTRQIEELRTLEGKAGVLRQFSVLNYVLEETLDAWDRSKRVRKTKVAGVQTKDVSLLKNSKGTSTELPGTETTKKSSQKEEEVIGDASYLDRALKASKEIRELLGLDAPEVKRLLLTDKDPATSDLSDEDLRTLPTEELLRRYRATAGIGSELG